MGNMNGADFGDRQICRVCQYENFLVEMGRGTINGKPMGLLNIRCSRCGTPLGHYQIDWEASVKALDDKVTIEDGINREPSFVTTE